jgi:hypothetical protein
VQFPPDGQAIAVRRQPSPELTPLILVRRGH